MLNYNIVLNYIKQNLGYPTAVLEMTDEEIIKYIQDFTLLDFSTYLPHKNKIGMSVTDPEYKTDIINEFYIFDPDGAEILNILEYISDLGPTVVSGHPILGIMSMDELPNYAYQVEKARNTDLWSPFAYTFEFIPPNRIRIEPDYDGYITIIYERVHLKDLSTIPTFAKTIFLNYCLGNIMLLLARKRKKFATIQTPYGEVQLNADDLKSEGQELMDKVKEQLILYNPGIVIDIG